MPRKDVPFSLDPLDPRFVHFKPRNSVEESKILQIEKAEQLIMTRKRDGYMCLAAITPRGIRLYSRTVGEEWTPKFPRIVQGLENLTKLRLRYWTLVAGELLVDEDGIDNYEMLAKIVKTDVAQALRLQEQHPVRYMIFNIPIFDGDDISRVPNERRLSLIYGLFFPRNVDSRYVFPLHVFRHNVSFAEARIKVRDEGWEGLVLYDAEKPGPYRLDGNHASPPRPEGCWKWKPRKEDDFIVRGWEKGTKGKRHADRMGKLFLSQIDARTGNEFSCGDVGIGVSDELRKKLADNRLYPLVAQVEFERRFPSGKLRHASFVRIRPDKRINECLYYRPT